MKTLLTILISYVVFVYAIIAFVTWDLPPYIGDWETMDRIAALLGLVMWFCAYYGLIKGYA